MGKSSGFSLVTNVFAWSFCAMILGKGADCLMCYQCATTAASGPSAGCISDLKGMLDTARGDEDFYAKNCTDTNPKWKLCMIQEAQLNNQQVLYMRDCHDGETFSHEYATGRFDKMRPNNQTTCSSIGATKKFVCFTFCDTDFCNGPQIPEKEPTICELSEDNPYDVILPPNATCSNTGGTHNHGNRPMGLQWLGVAAALSFMILASFSLS